MKVSIFKRERQESVSCYLIFSDGGKRVQYNTGIKLHKLAPRGTKAEKENKENERLLQEIKRAKEKELLFARNGVQAPDELKDQALGDLISEYIKRAETKKSREGRSVLLSIFRGELARIVGKIDSNFIQEQLDTIKSDSRLKDTTRKHYIIILVAFFHYWQKKGLFSGLLESVDSSLKVHQEKRHYLTKEQISQIETYWKESPLPESFRRSIGAFLFACYSGLRLSDVEKFKESQSVKNGLIVLKQTKTSEVVKVPYIEKARIFLEGRDSFLLPSRSTIRHALDRVALDLFPDLGWSLSFHTSRHSFAVNALNANIDLYSVSRFLGHSSIHTTQIYAELSEEKAKDELSKFSEYMGK